MLQEVLSESTCALKSPITISISKEGTQVNFACKSLRGIGSFESSGGRIGGSINGQDSHVGQVILQTNLDHLLRHRLEDTASSLPSRPCLGTEEDNHIVDV